MPPHVNGMQHVIFYIFFLSSFIKDTLRTIYFQKTSQGFFKIKKKLACKTHVTSQNVTFEEHSNPAPFYPPLLLILVVVDLGPGYAVELDLALLLHTVELDLGPPHTVELGPSQ